MYRSVITMKKSQLTGIAIGLFCLTAFGEKSETFSVTTTAIKPPSEVGFFSGLHSSGRIDSIYAAKEKGQDNPRSFPITWNHLSKGTKSLALIFDDPDAKPILALFGMKGESFLHWTAANIDPNTNGLPDNASKIKHLFIEGSNGAGTLGFIGPKPPSDLPKKAKKPIIHIYRFTLFALSEKVNLKDGYSQEELKSAMKGKIIAQSELLMSYNN